MYYVSPNYPISKLQSGIFSDKLDVFEDQFRNWYLAHARALANPTYPSSQHAGFAILAIIGVYFEAIASFMKGESSDGRSKEFFRSGFAEVFPTLLGQAEGHGFADPAEQIKKLADAFYQEVRCGIFHESMTRRTVVITSGDTPPLQMVADRTSKVLKIEVNPFRLVGVVENHLQNYLSKLRDETNIDLRCRFETEWDRRVGT